MNINQMPLVDRFWMKVQKTDGCWNWTGAKLIPGYGTIQDNHRKMRAHRLAYELLVGPIPDGLVLDHLCRNKGCVRPDHLEAVTQAENLMRGNGVGARHARKTHCNYGHEFNEQNTVVRYYHNRPVRCCKPCEARRNALRKTRKTIADSVPVDPYRATEVAA